MAETESALPSKLFFRIGEVASLVGVEPHVLRYWEREFRSIRPTKSAKGQRVYSRKDVENLLRVRDLLYRDGFTIAGAKKRLQKPGDAASTMPETDGAASAVPEPAADETRADDHDVPLDTTRKTPRETIAAPHAPLSPRAALVDGAEIVRAKLTALRTEIEAYLDELDPPMRRHDRSERV